MWINRLRLKIRAELEAVPEQRRLGTGWLSGTAALVASLVGLFLVLCWRHPGLLTTPELQTVHQAAWFPWLVYASLLIAFVLAMLNLVLRPNKTLGLCAITLTMLASLRGSITTGLEVESSQVFFGLDFFVLNVIFTGFLFVPLELLFPKVKDQPLFRNEWREDLFYYLVSSLCVQVLTFLTFGPWQFILANTQWTEFRRLVGSQPAWAQFFEIMFLTDLAQYWVHRLFHQVKFLWQFHAVHHSAQSMDWMAGARMHFFEIVILRATTSIPMFTLGFQQGPLQAYLLFLYVHSTFIHANLHWDFNWVGRFFVTPRFHHWHHGIEREAIDVNFAIHFPLFDKLFGTLHLPKGVWPTGYGIGGHPVPKGYWRQFLYPFRKRS